MVLYMYNVCIARLAYTKISLQMKHFYKKMINDNLIQVFLSFSSMFPTAHITIPEFTYKYYRLYNHNAVLSHRHKHRFF